VQAAERGSIGSGHCRPPAIAGRAGRQEGAGPETCSMSAAKPELIDKAHSSSLRPSSTAQPSGFQSVRSSPAREDDSPRRLGYAKVVKRQMSADRTQGPPSCVSSYFRSTANRSMPSPTKRKLNMRYRSKCGRRMNLSGDNLHPEVDWASHTSDMLGYAGTRPPRSAVLRLQPWFSSHASSANVSSRTDAKASPAGADSRGRDPDLSV
jgi:hypothetical protein